jgi:hypothetical protein
MTAPRNCRQCGSALPPTGRSCRVCSEPVRELSPRPRTEGTYVGLPKPVVRTSRWKASTLTFGPVGRLAITAVVVLFGASSMVQGFNPAMIWPLGMYVVAATLILKHIWKPVRLPESETASDRPPPDRHLRHPTLYRSIDPRLLWGAAGVIALVATVLVLPKIHVGLLFLPAVAAVMLGVGLILAWLSGD